MASKRLTDINTSSGVTLSDFIHIVDPNDLSQDAAGSSYKATLQQVYDAFNISGGTDNYVTGGTYSNGTLILDRQNGSVTISGFYTGDTFVFTGNTSATCITDLYVHNLHGCSPINVQDSLIMSSLTNIRSANGGGQIDLDYGGSGDEVFISTDNGLYNAQQLYLSNGYVELSDYSTGGGVNVYAENIILASGLPAGHPTPNITIASNTPDSNIIIGVEDGSTRSDTIKISYYGGSNGSTENFDKKGTIISSRNSFFFGDTPSASTIVNSVILGGSNIQATDSNKVYVSALNIKELGTGTSVNNLGIDINGNVVYGTVFSATTDITITGGTYNPMDGTATFYPNVGSPFYVTGFLTGYTDVQVSNLSYTDNILIITQTDGSTFSATTPTTTFTGNTSATCITDLYVRNVLDCVGTSKLDLRAFNTSGTLSLTTNIYNTNPTLIMTETAGSSGEYIKLGYNNIPIGGTRNTYLEFDGGDFGTGYVRIRTNDTYFDVFDDYFELKTSYGKEVWIYSGITTIDSTLTNVKKLNISDVGTTTPLYNLGIDSNGFVVTGITSNYTFTGNTSASCIVDLYVRNLHGCSPITIHDQIQSLGSTATGTSTVAIGSNVQAIGNYSHAEGNGTQATGAYSHAEGYSTVAVGGSSHTEGQITTTLGQWSHAEGEYTVTQPQASSSHAEGSLTETFGVASHAEGNGTKSVGDYSHAEGYFTVTSGTSSHAEGWYSTSIGNYSHAEGYFNTSIGNYSHAEGYNTISFGIASHTEGTQTSAMTANSHAEGQLTFAYGAASHAEGDQTQALGNYSHTEGGSYDTGKGVILYTIASGISSHAEGIGTYAYGNHSHTEGRATEAIGDGAHAEGDNTSAIGNYSHAAGYNTITNGGWSYAGGDGTIADALYQHVVGRQNVPSSVQAAFIIGNGSTLIGERNLLHAAGTEVNISGKTITTELQVTSGANDGYVLTSDVDGNATWQTLDLIDSFYEEPSVTSVTWDVSGNSSNYKLILTGNTTLDLNNVRNGDYGTIILIQDAIGGYGITLGNVNGGTGTHLVVNGGGGTITLTTTPNAIDILSFVYDGTNVYWNTGLNYN